MMKFVILRVAQIDENRKKKTVLVEWDEKKILEKLRIEIMKEFDWNGVNASNDVADIIEKKFKRIINKFKQETLTIP